MLTAIKREMNTCLTLHLVLFIFYLTVPAMGYWRQRADESLGILPQLTRSLQWSKTRMEDPQVSLG